jgi:hypothetical protein
MKTRSQLVSYSFQFRGEFRSLIAKLNSLPNFLSIACLALSANLAVAQGVVAFRNDVLSSPPDRLVRDTFGQPLVGANFIAQLLYETSPDSFTPHPDMATFRQPTTPLPGTWIGGSRTLSGAGGIFIPVRMQVRVWDGGFGAASLSFDEARATGNQWGASDVFTYTEDISVGVPHPSDKYMWEFRGFQLVPEPTIWALLSLGAVWLLWRHVRSR